ncbi:hypothetical protein BJF85_06600 [Saccharomonospora sp. CUA-673]|uniref:DUF2283 domain-containing protein n=1 Tax=Saccharomonospora sp. CUA-673 TaxID=1904969 RepID=UPI00095F2925|nr:DUF2283 domain-containing protein [Saccharomonospora sp. CUA-673]OLT40007.1 hypothetical protein BJF85_06600 [Saccharomonospora sp. CUA-673]
MRIELDPKADAAYISLTGDELEPGRQTLDIPTPPDVAGSVVMDWKDGKLVGLEVLGASELLPPDFLARATNPGER